MTSPTPAVTFVVSAFHRPLALRCCLSSLVLQTFTDFEIIVTDNSFDPTINAQHEAFCRMDPRIRYRLTRAIGGDYAAEIAVPEARGEFLGFPSDDSFYVIWYAEKMIAAARANNWELVYCDLVMAGPVDGGVLTGDAKLGHIDKTSFLLKRDRFIEFPDKLPSGTASDGYMIDELVLQGIRHGRVGQPLAVHQ